MIKIQYSSSPYTYKPIIQLIKELDIAIDSNWDGLCMSLIDPLNEAYTIYKNQSHLTDQQPPSLLQRLLGIPETDRKLKYLAKKIAQNAKDYEIIFYCNGYIAESNHIINFCRILSMYNARAIINILNKPLKEKSFISKEIEEAEILYYSDPSIVKDYASKMIDIVLKCFHKGDYFTALNFLERLNTADLDNEMHAQVYDYLSMGHRITNNRIISEYYAKKAQDSGSYRIRLGASYALSMLHTKTRDKDFLDINLGIKLLEKARKEINRMPDSISKKIDEIFNANGLALTYFKQGKFEEAKNIVINNIKQLEEIGNAKALFIANVSRFNLFQCYAKLKEEKLAVDTLMNLISLDPKFFAYYDHMAAYFLSRDRVEDAIQILNKGIEVDKYYFRFYYLLGKLHLRTKDFDTALKYFSTSYDINREDWVSLSNIVVILNYQRKFKEVLDRLSAIDFNAIDKESLVLLVSNKVIALLQLNDDFISEAEELLEMGLRIAPKNEMLLKTKEMIYEHNNKKDTKISL